MSAAPACRLCRAPLTRTFVDLGSMPLANAFLRPEQLREPEPRFPLHARVCSECLLVQVEAVASPQEIFGDYAYFSSYAASWVEHARRFALDAAARFGLDKRSMVVEVASNDGYLLQFYVQRGVPVLGIDPARNVAERAVERGVNTICAFFDRELAEELRSKGYRADVLHANNVLAHVPDVNGVVRGIARVLADDGLAVIETPYIRDLVERVEFDTIYHEHVFYYSLTSLTHLVERHGLSVVDVQRIPIHGGSLRVVVTHTGAGTPGAAVDALLDEERTLGLSSAGSYQTLADRVAHVRRELVGVLQRLKSDGAQLAAYGAAAKGTVLLNAFGIGRETIDFVADRSEHKQGRYMPGVHLPIVPAERLLADQPDAVLLLAWNFAEEVIAQQREYLARGGAFIIPIPVPKIIRS
jgi:C-methyltransferase C-terminal domain/Putative zinc binding domain/Methyltransferase domain